MEPGEERHQISAAGAAKSLAFIALIQAVALFFTWVNAPVTAESGYSFAPAGTSSAGSVWNVAILVAFVFSATVAAVWLARRRQVRIFMGIVFVGTALALFLLTLLTSIDITVNYMDEYTSLYLSIALSVGIIAMLGAVTFKRGPSWSPLLITGLLSAEVGSYFASTIPLVTALLLPLAFSLYDIYTVFRGPLKTLLTALPDETLSAITSKVGEFSIGTGDTVFYAMVPSLAYYQFTLTSALYTLIAIDAGIVLTLYLLKRSKLLPGLPIPMALGLAAILLSGLL